MPGGVDANWGLYVVHPAGASTGVSGPAWALDKRARTREDASRETVDGCNIEATEGGLIRRLALI
jgi:hypothetical protein